MSSTNSDAPRSQRDQNTGQAVEEMFKQDRTAFGLDLASIFHASAHNVGGFERLLSAMIGMLLLFFLRRRLLLYLAAATVAGYLVYRGSSGRCALYEAFGVDTTTLEADTGEESGSHEAKNIPHDDSFGASQDKLDGDGKPMATSGLTDDPTVVPRLHRVAEGTDNDLDEMLKESFPVSDPPTT